MESDKFPLVTQATNINSSQENYILNKLLPKGFKFLKQFTLKDIDLENLLFMKHLQIDIPSEDVFLIL